MKSEYFENIRKECERELNRDSAKAHRLLTNVEKEIEQRGIYKETIEKINENRKSVESYKVKIKKQTDNLFNTVFFNSFSTHPSLEFLSNMGSGFSFDVYEKFIKNIDTAYFKKSYDDATKALLDEREKLIFDIGKRASYIEKCEKLPKFIKNISFISKKIDEKIAEPKRKNEDAGNRIVTINAYLSLIEKSKKAFSTLMDLFDSSKNQDYAILNSERRVVKCYEDFLNDKVKELKPSFDKYHEALELRSPDHKKAVIEKHFNQDVVSDLAQNPEFLIELGRIDALNSAKRDDKKINNYLIDCFTK